MVRPVDLTVTHMLSRTSADLIPALVLPYSLIGSELEELSGGAGGGWGGESWAQLERGDTGGWPGGRGECVDTAQHGEQQRSSTAAAENCATS